MTDADLHEAIARYDSVLAEQARRVGKRTADSDLVALDSYVHSELPATLRQRADAHLTLDELCKVVRWKLAVRPSRASGVYNRCERASSVASGALDWRSSSRPMTRPPSPRRRVRPTCTSAPALRLRPSSA
jgi:hypothetical protein